MLPILGWNCCIPLYSIYFFSGLTHSDLTNPFAAIKVILWEHLGNEPDTYPYQLNIFITNYLHHHRMNDPEFLHLHERKHNRKKQ